ncbi:response regulator [Stenomitos frigidus]|uniref:Diguanylate cyclase response regulator n=1 Tax=Stenomitos frigidus ULC18 TaxID=2107698 RepID=A0A2T1DVJ0_9CYAN|nr:PleD family two-component system response regulator [Stenomitos frigidus]PSB24451.1 diguanylate cyclase response regulator [Stenomitos frigidus ULC18]
MLEDCKESIILIVDDNPTNLLVLSQTLKDIGLKVRVSMDGESALEQAIEETPDLILLDIQMPGIDGFETCKRLKLNPSVSDIPVIFITANNSTENIVEGLSLGAVDYIVKPFQKEEVLARVQVHLRLRLLTRKVQEQAIALQIANQQLECLANLDGLTQVANRRRFDEQLDLEWKRLTREPGPLSLILCDIDYFKRYNDFYGHQAGDTCLKQVAKALEQSLKRPGDFVARYGGEEFVVILPNTNFDGASHVAEIIQTDIEKLYISHAQSQVSTHITLSLGISSMIPTKEASESSLIAAADKALYEAKRRGRNTFYHEFSAV